MTTRSPGSTVAKIAAARPALAPWVQTTRSGVTSPPWRAVKCSAIACCRVGEPASGAYRVRPARSAATAASTTTGGVPSEGSPMARETTPPAGAAPMPAGRRDMVATRVARRLGSNLRVVIGSP